MFCRNHPAAALRRWRRHACQTLHRGFGEGGGDAPWPVGEPFLILAHLGEYGPSWDEGALLERERVDHPGVGCCNGLLHLHRLDHEEELSLLDLLALFDEHLHDRTRHRGCEAGGGVRAWSGFVHGRWRRLSELM